MKHLKTDKQTVLLHASQKSGSISGQTFEYDRLGYLITLPLMWLLSRWVNIKRKFLKLLGASELKTNSLWYDGLGKKCRRIKEGAASWRALDIIYHFPDYQEKQGAIDTFWINMRNAQAVRNRFKIIQEEIFNAIVECAGSKKPTESIRILSLASGSAQGVLNAVSEYMLNGLRVEILLIDIDGMAGEYVKREAQKLSVPNVEFIQGDIFKFESYLADFKPDIIEMLGFLDYLKDPLAIRLIRRIKKKLKVNGFFFTCHIHNNSERDFLYNVVNWGRDPHMLYRSAEKLDELVEMGGFSDRFVITEPHGIHSILRARI